MQRTFALILAVFAIAAQAQTAPGGKVPVAGSCEGCEAVFQGLPATFAAPARIAPAGEPGEPLALSGVVTDRAGKPQAGVVVYAYHTDRTGIYPRDASLSGAAARHGRLRGWARTDDAGRYAFDTIRPAAYPGRSIPQHVHLHVIEPGRCTYYLGDVLFADDPLLTPALRERERNAPGGDGVVTPKGDAKGWTAARDIVLGLNVPEHAVCGGSSR
ncbi:hypothetical protein [Tahibacter soli]|uniref:Intradiol ring-cleavage dioxygenases domain-containing protein n=1 Tax=Tahibacter soli TaxID=2983605 RepID=A0A9X3YMC9_9GAMM|nr:hypothetical protein [Tahibacter soli]MDC8014964.1 hypothetical protein [Tahibacter soli]